MVKASPHIHYTYHHHPFTLNPLYRQLIRPQWGRSDLIGSCRVMLRAETGILPLKIVFVRDQRSESKEWLALWSTDLTKVTARFGRRGRSLVKESRHRKLNPIRKVPKREAVSFFLRP